MITHDVPDSAMNQTGSIPRSESDPESPGHLQTALSIFLKHDITVDSSLRTRKPVELQAMSQYLMQIPLGTSDRIPPLDHLNRLYETIQRAWTESGTLDHLDSQILARLPWVLLFPWVQPTRWLANDPSLLDHSMNIIQSRCISPGTVILLKNYLMVYPIDSPIFDPIGQTLRGIFTQYPYLAGIRRWAARCEQFHLLELDGPDTIASLMWKDNGSYMQFFEQNGFRHYLVHSALIQRVTRSLLMVHSHHLTNQTLPDERWDHLYELLEPEPDALRFPDLGKQTITRLLSPVKKGDYHLSHPQREKLKTFILRHWGEPQKGNPGWDGIPEDLHLVMHRWTRQFRRW